MSYLVRLINYGIIHDIVAFELSTVFLQLKSLAK